MASRTILWSAMGASVSTSLAEILGGAIALNMLFDIPIKVGAVLVAVFVFAMMFSNSYKKIERYIIAFVSLIGLSFIYELFLVDIEWGEAAQAWVVPSIPEGSMLIIMSVLGAVVMPHNLFLHSEVIQSRQWNLQDEAVIEKKIIALMKDRKKCLAMLEEHGYDTKTLKNETKRRDALRQIFKGEQA